MYIIKEQKINGKKFALMKIVEKFSMQTYTYWIVKAIGENNMEIDYELFKQLGFSTELSKDCAIDDAIAFLQNK